MAEQTAPKKRPSSTPVEQRVLGIEVPAPTVAALVSQMQTPLFDEGWLQAMLGGAAIWAALWFLAIATAFLPDMPAADPERLGTQLRVAAVVGVLAAGFWGWWYSRYRRLKNMQRPAREAEQQRLVGWHRVHALLLVLLLGAGMVWQGFTISAGVGALALLAALALLLIGYRLAPLVLRFIAGEHTRALRAAGAADVVLLVLTGLIAGGGVLIPFLSDLPPIGVIFSLMSLLAVLGLPVAAALLAWALLHFRAARGAR